MGQNVDAGNAVSPDQPPAPVTDRGRRKRAAIVTAARGVFEEHGFREARIADIAKAARASYGSFYTYFSSKEEVFREVVRQVTSEMFQTTRPAAEVDDPGERIEQANRRYVASYARNARMMAVMNEVAAYDDYTATLISQIRARFIERNAEGIRRLQERGIASADVDPAIAGDLLGGMVERFAQEWVTRRSAAEIDEALPVLTAIWTGGIGLHRSLEPEPG